MQFGRLNAFTAAHPIIAQRVDEPSTNSYSVLPVLSQVGVITREKPLVPATKHLPGPILAVGEPGSGLTALATALSMLGYTCCSDLDRLPTPDRDAMLRGRYRQRFNAYVNVDAFSGAERAQFVASNPDARIIATSPDRDVRAAGERWLLLTPDTRDRWAALSEFLGVEYPPFPYPDDDDVGRRAAVEHALPRTARPAFDLKSDAGPWIMKPARGVGRGVGASRPPLTLLPAAQVDWAAGDRLDFSTWMLRDDTFPSNMALFSPDNVREQTSGAMLTLREQPTAVRNLTSGALASRGSFRFGRFQAILRPSGVTGVVTGMFLHRNGPRQEIDIEFLGKDTTKMLVNVFYNPGPEGTKLEYGYRGTPTLIDLGFNAAADFHTYAIDWQPDVIRWLVDGEVVYERINWSPTPIPNQPLQFNLNLWHSRSKEFAGGLDRSLLPATANIQAVEILATQSDADDDSFDAAVTRQDADHSLSLSVLDRTLGT